ncbi:MAG: glycoside hydrolase family 3 protein [Treponema sp.]|nr:glycoside hydrolase family 3 protein [Treponema sp.]
MRKKLSAGVFLLLLFCQSLSAERSADRSMEIAAGLDDSALAAQVILTGISGSGSLSPSMAALLDRIPAGGIMLFRQNLASPKEDVKRFLSQLYNLIEENAGIPPFISADHEGGLVHRFGPGVERLPSAMSFWEDAQGAGRYAALIRAESLYRRSAAEIRELGISMVLAPVAEILNEENRSFLQSRSYGPDPDFTLAAAEAYIKGMEAEGIASVVKHFPGNSAVDPHYGIAVLEADRAALDEMTGPFAGLIRSMRPAAMMISHVMIPALDGERNASLSEPLIEGWLRGELGFKGIVMADDYAMSAVTDRGLDPPAAAVMGLAAGVDMIMVWPDQLEAVHTAILQALEDGSLSRQRLQQAAARVIAEKIRFGLI